MKRLLALLVLMIGIASVTFAQTDQKATDKKVAPAKVVDMKKATDAKMDVNGPKMVFENETIDYGTIEQGSDPYRIFTFVNEGTEPLIISNARGSCGCTVPSHPKEPIMPGQTAEVKVRYDTNRLGPFTKRVTLTTNETENTRVLTIKGLVEKKVEEPGLPENDKKGTFGGGN
ncbi:MAG: DUF1573 domain-containing protein [Saprospiraceae bacterium]